MARFSKVPKTFRARKAFRKTPPAHSVKLVFLYVVKGLKIKITAKFRVLKRPRFEDTKRILSPEKFRDFGEMGPWSLIFGSLTVGYHKLKHQKIEKLCRPKSSFISGSSSDGSLFLVLRLRFVVQKKKNFLKGVRTLPRKQSKTNSQTFLCKLL